MDTNRIKRFATEARNILLSGVVQRLTTLGFQPDGTATEKPELLGGGSVFMGEVQSEDFYHKWMSLYQRMQSHSFREVAEEAAYTWFNRLVAIRIMVKNGLIPPVLEYKSEEVRIPVIVTEARQGRMPQMDDANRQKLDSLMLNDALTDEQFTLLIVAYCHSNPIIRKCFGKIADYTELLLPSNILKNDGFIDRLNADDYLSDDDYRSPELIGWLYQFYISERKDEVFAKKGKFEADEIPAATQIFTPNWIVKYMVQNTVGRIYLDNNPYSDIKEGMKYLVEPDEPTLADAVYQFDDIHDLKVADLACGSGHILNECFDLLYQIYMEEGYNRRRAVEDIFRYNLTGVDIDTRAKQLAMFALLLKACQKDRSFIDAHVLPRILDMPKAGLPLPTDTRLANEIEAVNQTLADADTLGSIMKFNLSPAAREWVASLGEENDAAQLVLALTDKYAALVMNPPYMELGKMNGTLYAYINREYKDGKNDLFTAFMILAYNQICDNGKYAMINMDTWTFKSSFMNIRDFVLFNLTIDSLILLGAKTFEELNGEVVQNVCFCASKNISKTKQGAYYNVSNANTCSIKRDYFINNEKNNLHFIRQTEFFQLPGHIITVINNAYLNLFSSLPALSTVGVSKQGLATGCNDNFVRYWYEVSSSKIGFNINSTKDAFISQRKWFPYNKGGNCRKWYGNQELIVNWENDGEKIKNYKGVDGKLRSRPQNTQYYFRPSISWGLISGPFFRYFPNGFIYDIQGMSYFPNNKDNIYAFLSWMNSKPFRFIGKVVNPREQYQAGDLIKLPSSNTDLSELGKANIRISKSDWDAHETSWDFQENELVRLSKKKGDCSQRLSDLMDAYKEHWTEQFLQLYANEEELNRQFIEIYGLQDELTPDVPLDEITILQQGEKSIENGQLVWHDDVIVKQLISYAVGCMMGRYSLDRKGLILANQGDGQKEYEALVPNSRFAIDDDGIIPLMSVNNELTDHVTLRFKAWLNAAFGEENFMDNLNFVERALNKRLEDYFLKDFWKDHKNKDMYQNRPIYWLFSSKKGAFQCIVYMHRMNAYTAEKIRTKYLLPHIEWLMTKQAEMQANAANLSVRERKELDNIGKQIDECREYHDRLHVVADKQIAFDLDDGVVVNYAKFGDVLAKLK